MAAALLTGHSLPAYGGAKENIRLFQSFFHDVAFTRLAYAQGAADYNSYQFSDVYSLTARAGFPLTLELDLGLELGFLNINPDFAESRSGLTDLMTSVRYNFISDVTVFAGGAYITLPTGNEDVGQNNIDFGVFGAVRHPVSEYVVLTGTLGLDFIEVGDGRRTSLYVGAGSVFETSDYIHLVGELAIRTEYDYAALSGGIEYNLPSPGKLRGMLLVGLDDGAPDFGFSFGYLITF